MSASDAMPVPKQGVPYLLTFDVLRTNGEGVSALTDPVPEVSLDLAPFQSTSNEAVLLDDGTCHITLDGTEMNTNITIFRFSCAEGKIIRPITICPEKVGDIRVALTAVGNSVEAVTKLLDFLLSGYNMTEHAVVALSNDATTALATTIHTELQSEFNETYAVADDARVAAEAAATDAAAIKLKTDNLPASPAATGDIPSASANATAVWASGTRTITDKTGFKLASDGLDSISTTAPTGPASNFRQMVVQVWRRWFKFTEHDPEAETLKTYADDGTTVITTQELSVDSETGVETQGAAE